MPEIMDGTTIAAAFAASVAAHAGRPFLAVPANPAAPGAPDVKALAFTGTSPWLPIGGMALIGAAFGTRRLRRRITA